MLLILLAMGLLLFCGFLALCFRKRARLSNILGAGGAIAGCIAGLAPAAAILWSGNTEQIRAAWDVPYGSFFLQIDSLSALFLIPIFILCGLSALYGMGYMKAYIGRKDLGAFWFFFNVLTASMSMVAVAANGVLFLIAWEVMALSSFFLVTFENEEESVRRAGWTYLTATHLGTAFLLVLFLLLGRHSGTGLLDFDEFLSARGQLGPLADIIFILAVVGFGTKAGFIPFHVWLPEAHPAAPSPVSAVMSGVMLKTGIYGFVRTLTFLGAPSSWWGWLIIGIGLVSGILGVLFALAQHDIKRLLAYHSVENIGIIALGIGIGILGSGPTCAGPCRVGLWGRIAARGKSRAVQGVALPGSRFGPARDGHEGDRPPGRPYQTHALDGRDLSGRCGRDMRSASFQRICKRISDLPGRLQSSWQAPILRSRACC